LPSLVALDIVLITKKKKKTKNKSGSTTTVQNWTPRRIRTREVCDFLNTSSNHAVSTYNQPNLELTQNQPSFLRPKFWALDTDDIESAKITHVTHVKGVSIQFMSYQAPIFQIKSGAAGVCEG
jgi:hypothetical protein